METQVRTCSTPSCGGAYYAKGVCANCYYRLHAADRVTLGMLKSSNAASVVKLRRAMRSPTGMYDGPTDAAGYPRVTIKMRSIKGHRAAAMLYLDSELDSSADFFQLLGIDVNNLSVLHDNGVRLCVKPDQLYFGTALENVEDSIRHQTHHWPVLNWDHVEWLRKHYGDVPADERPSYKQIAVELKQRYGVEVTSTSVGLVLTGKTWRTPPTPRVTLPQLLAQARALGYGRGG